MAWKLEKEYFMEGEIIIFIGNYLGQRFTAVIFEGRLTKWKEGKVGTPQGGSLIPILFIIYLNHGDEIILDVLQHAVTSSRLPP